ncbi:MAG TPA: hypothetical protein VFU37_12105, partial [Pyrinomonadaceae bacterium]|nr:hypothetical protein [Pyrinomonadaceae bacterium]
MSPDGSRVAYPVRTPDIGSNKDLIAVYVKSVPILPTDSNQPIIRGDIIGLRWRPDGQVLTALINENGRRVLEEIDPTSGTHHVLVSARDDIAEYTTSSDGNVVVYGTLMPNAATAANRSDEASASGYLVPFEENPGGLQFREQLFLTRRQGTTWTPPELLTIQSPLSGELQKGLVYGGAAPNLMPTLSPDGNSLLVTYYDYSQKMPDEWRKSGKMQARNQAGVIQAFRLLVLYD